MIDDPDSCHYNDDSLSSSTSFGSTSDNKLDSDSDSNVSSVSSSSSSSTATTPLTARSAPQFFSLSSSRRSKPSSNIYSYFTKNQPSSAETISDLDDYNDSGGEENDDGDDELSSTNSRSNRNGRPLISSSSSSSKNSGSDDSDHNTRSSPSSSPSSAAQQNKKSVGGWIKKSDKQLYSNELATFINEEWNRRGNDLLNKVKHHKAEALTTVTTSTSDVIGQGNN